MRAQQTGSPTVEQTATEASSGTPLRRIPLAHSVSAEPEALHCRRLTLARAVSPFPPYTGLYNSIMVCTLA